MSLNWCKKQGMKLIEPNDNLAEEYFKNSEETLRITNLIKDSGSNMWLATQKYYTEYLAAYSLLMKIGIKSEIHSCTIEVIELLEKEKIIDFNFSRILNEDKQLKIDNQYYLKNIPVKFDHKQLSEIVLKVKQILDTITDEQIKKIRDIVKKN
ncbi:hypothetical protein HZA96_07145 [Candidatus Woesearchaeota archaeon]|nr:hypothetical protein [Candidatus Woesearchaeota archaeon]